jgi:hypothetical protein
MKTSAERSSRTASSTVTQAAQRSFIARKGSESFFAPVRGAAASGVQAKMTVNKPGDKFEQEADKTADKVMRMPAPPAAAKDEKLQRAPEDKLQRAPEEKLQKREEEKILRAALPEDKVQKAEDPKLQKAPAAEEKLQRREEEKILKAAQPEEKVQKAEDNRLQKAPADEKLQRRNADGSGSTAVSGDVQSAIHNKTTGGEPLSSDVRGHMEPRFSADFGTVRIHKDSESAALSNQLSARAFTYQNHIFFSRGQYQPGSSEGQHLLAHELTHTIQQGHSIQRTPQISTTAATPTVQRLGIQDALDKFAEWAFAIPGFRLLTIVLGFNPINMRSADRNAANLLRALIELVPGGAFITQALDNHGVINKAAAWIEQKIAALGDIGGEIAAALKQFLNSLSWTDIFDLGGVWDRAKNIFTGPISRLIAFGASTVVELLKMVKDAVLKPLAAMAQGTRGYDLLRVILGEDPISGEPVPRSAENLLGGFMKLIGQEEIWENIKKGNAIARAYAWFQTALDGLMGMVRAVPKKIVDTITSLTFQDIITVAGAFGKIVGAFVSIAGDFISWGLTTIWNLLEIVFDVVKPGLMGYIKKTGAALKSILKNPIPFLGNLINAAKLGFTNFAGNILGHLKAGLIDWLTGSLQGVYIPKALSLPELGKFAMSVLGITWAQIRGKIVKVLGPNGEKIMQGLEQAFDVVVALVTGGPAAAWELIKEKLTELKDQVVGGIIDFVVDTIVKKAVPKLIAMFIPGAGFISAIISIYDTVMVFVQKISKIIQVVTAFIDSIVTIAAGNITAAANRVESILGGLLSLAISFLAGFLGLGKITDKVMGVIQKVRASVDKAIDAAIAWIVAKAKALFAKLFSSKDKPDERTPEQKSADLQRGVADGTSLLKGGKQKPSDVAKKLAPIQAKYRLSQLTLVIIPGEGGKQKTHIHGAINPELDGSDVDSEGEAVDALTIWEASAMETPAEAKSEQGPVVRLNPANAPYALAQIRSVFAANNVPAPDADSALVIIEQLIADALTQTSAKAIENRLKSVSGVANKALKAGGTGTVINAHHSQPVERHPGTFPETRTERMAIPAQIKQQIEAWLAQHPGMTKNDADYKFIVSTIKSQLFEMRHPTLEKPLDYIDIIISTAQSHRKLHSVTG